jgi:hypothetical protein
VRVVKTFTYRGAPKEFSNRYHFNGGTPASNSAWTALFDAIVLAEKAVYTSGVEIIECIGYEAGSELPVWTKSYTTVGTLAPGSPVITPGDSAAVVRYATTAKTSNNHPIFLYNYYHGVFYAAGVDPDLLHPSLKTALETYASDWLTGFSDGAITAVRAGPYGATAVDRIVKPEIRHRDFPG